MAMASVLPTVESQLKRKASFEEGVKALVCFFSEAYSSSDIGQQSEALRLLGRTHTLLKSRYSSLPFWKSGQALFLTALANVTGSPSDFRRVSEYLESAESIIAEAEGVAEPSTQPPQNAARNPQTLFEGQLSQEPERPSGNPPLNVADLLAHLVSLGSQPESETPPADADAENPSTGPEGQREAGDNENNAGGLFPESADDFADQMRRIQEGMMEALEASNTGMESVLAGMERVEQGVQDVLHAIGGDEGESTAPPAAKIVVDSLPRKKLAEEDITTLGKDTTCPVCMDSFQCGDDMTALPCKHVFHIACLKQWLKRRNSCPLCRHELPTDDREYELRKEREEERRGARNALSHNEFMYI
ncbi:hypothetical protein BSKO_13314 [Bryopsis sp. KO-2023]|nr:hypothetical protein BSKO_13314 [Bryopsis sp. KO-2023]